MEPPTLRRLLERTLQVTKTRFQPSKDGNAICISQSFVNDRVYPPFRAAEFPMLKVALLITELTSLADDTLTIIELAP